MNTPGTRSNTAGWVLGAPSASTVDRSVPDSVSAVDLSTYCLMLGDDALVLSARLSEWGVRGSDLATDIALATIALDLLRQARILLERAGELEGAGRDENRLAHFRDAAHFRNVRLAEVDCGPGRSGDFAATVARLLVMSTWRAAVFERLARTRDPVLSDQASRSIATLTAHRDHAGRWAASLGRRGTEERAALADGLERIWPLVGELFSPHPVELSLAEADCAVDPAAVRSDVVAHLDTVLAEARVDRPDPAVFTTFTPPGGREGAHTGSMEFLLAEMQYLARSAR
ncbi:ring-1,2-phenylacetyl-CoA epoxidase subunit PaaC [Saccharopolyspora erythraea NRRL 2338]|nr:1,2-phenylacetyl-CoA epoxidase subunit PaaC [Saccharopolyspora erythraea]PFG99717.1 ring-1,2-phenylacetyl-CoA epoxidase subunit PaaC [Saccharopolyspora erythraea NRRL 2338]QRK89600.1 phenylacetate-CoA oxygenase subunit PaaC [Saccharopolyspora erythraea]